MKNIPWDFEDTFFGALLGAFLGNFINKFPVEKTILLIIFMGLLSAVLRKAYQDYPKFALVIVNILIVVWLICFISPLVQATVIT